MTDLVLLVADKCMQFALQGGLRRHQSLGIREVSFDFFSHPGHDGGVRKTGAQMLALRRSQYKHGLLVLDHEGSGSTATPEDLERQLDDALEESWGENARAIVISPELETWLWASDNSLSQVLGWTDQRSIREWLAEHGFELDANEKPLRPKESLMRLMAYCQVPRSASTFERITSAISISKCSDRSVGRLRDTLQEWFAPL